MASEQPSLAGRLCALCRVRNSERNGEHVVPDWFMRDMTVDVDRDPDDPSRGREQTRPFGDIRLPCCKPCNDELNRRFENPGLTPARALLADGVQNLNPKQADRVRWWVLKTWVLLTHPLTDLSPVNFMGAAWPDADPTFYDWLINRGDPPEGFSLWVFWMEDSDGSGEPEVPCVDLPTVHADGARVRFRSLDVGLGRVSVTLVFHPSWEIAHPGEADGSVIRLWPAPERSPISTLPRNTYRPVMFRTGLDLIFEPRTYDHVSLPQLDPGFSPFAPPFAQYIRGGAAPKIGT